MGQTLKNCCNWPSKKHTNKHQIEEEIKALIFSRTPTNQTMNDKQQQELYSLERHYHYSYYGENQIDYDYFPISVICKDCGIEEYFDPISIFEERCDKCHKKLVDRLIDRLNWYY